MRNTEQLVGSVGLLSYRIGALEEYNTELKKYSPESFKANRVSVKCKQGQDPSIAMEKNNISVASFSGLQDIYACVCKFLYKCNHFVEMYSTKSLNRSDFLNFNFESQLLNH